MRLTVPKSLYIAGIILMGSAIISQFERSRLIMATVMLLIGIGILVRTFHSKQQISCLAKVRKPWGIVAMMALLLCMGFGIGKLTYLWLH